MVKFLQHKGFVLCVTAIVLYSFFSCSPLYYNYYSSDNAIHVLMASNFDFSTDLYYWGQDRLGSIVPMLAVLPVKMGCSPVYAVAVVQYLLLLGGFLFFSSFISNKIFKLALCLTWFLPLSVFFAHVEIGHPYTGQLFFLGLALYSFEKKYIPSRSSTWLFVSVFAFLLSAWVSDLMLFVLPIYLFYIALSLAKIEENEKYFNIKIPRFSFKRLLPIIGAVLSGLMFIVLAKKTAPGSHPEYDLVFSPVSKITEGLSLVTNKISDTVIFKVFNVLLSYQALACVILSAVLIIYWFKYKKWHEKPFVIKFLFLTTIVTFFIVVCSHWVELSKYEARYFTFTYYSFLLFLFMAADRLRKKQFSRIAIILSVIIALSTSIDNFVFNHIEVSSSRYLTVKKLKEITDELGDCGIIGDYWTSYNIASADPAHVVATSYNNYWERKPELGNAVMQKKNIYLVKDNWLNDFPTGIMQFGYMLKKTGSPFETHGLTFCKYTVVDEMMYPVSELSYRNIEVINENFAVKPDSTTYIRDQVVWGPRIALQPGKYRFSLEIGALNKTHQSDEITVDFTNSFGQQVLWAKYFMLKGNYVFAKKLNFNFEIRHYMPFFELQVFLNGRTQVYLKNMVLSKQKK